MELEHNPVLPVTRTPTLVSRSDFGAEMQVLTEILRFMLPQTSVWQRQTGRSLVRFEAGDLLGMVPKGRRSPGFIRWPRPAPAALSK